MSSGRFKGRTFQSQAEYDIARKSSPTPLDAEPATSRRAPQPPGYTKGMVEAVVKMIEGGLAFTPLFRDDNGITGEEHTWLVDDWFEFGKRNPFFARLVTNLFAVDLYGKLVMDHVVIFGSRLVTTGRLPEQAKFPIYAAYMARQAMAGEIVFTAEPEPSPDLGMETGGAPSVSGSNGYGQDLSSAEIVDAPAA